MAYNTGNAPGSKHPKDLIDNAEDFDYLLTGGVSPVPNRLGVPLKSWKGMEGEHDADQVRRESEFDTAQEFRSNEYTNDKSERDTEFSEDQAQRAADYAASEANRGYESPVPYVAGIALTRVTQLVQYNSELYKAKAGTLPWTTTGVWATDSAKLVSVGDAALRQELAAPPGSTKLGHVRAPLATAIDGTISKRLSQLMVDIGDFSHLVTSKPNPADYQTWDWTPAMEAAQVTVAGLGGGRITMGTGGVYLHSLITNRRFVVIDGQGCSELKQIGGSNKDFIVSENFAALTGTGATVSSSALVPSWFGLRDIRVNGNRYNATTNPTGNTSGRAIAWYGPAMIMQGNVLVYGAAGNNIYTEYSNISGSSGWQGQEEGQFDNVFSRDSGGIGWVFRGPHNSRLNSYIGAFNDGYGFKSESGANYDGGFDWIGSIHTYANGRGTTPAADTGISLGEIARIGAMITDGDNAVLSGSNIQVGSYRGYNLGGEMDGLTISGNAVEIANINAVVWASSVGRTAIKITGSRAKIGTLDLVTNNPDNHAISITGNSNQIAGGYVQGFSSAGRVGLALAGTKNKVELEITGCATAFNYTAGNNNRVTLEINTSAGQVAVAGSAPGSSDRFNIRSGGDTVGGCKTNFQTGLLAMDISTYTIVTVPHGLLYTPAPNAVRIDWLVSSPDSSVWDEALLRVVSTTSTDVVLGYKLASAAPAGTQARIGISINLT